MLLPNPLAITQGLVKGGKGPAPQKGPPEGVFVIPPAKAKGAKSKAKGAKAKCPAGPSSKDQTPKAQQEVREPSLRHQLWNLKFRKGQLGRRQCPCLNFRLF